MLRIIALLLLICATPSLASAPSFEQAKRILREKVYFDLNKGKGGDIYCGCDWEWVGRSGGRIDMASCGLQVRAQQTRAERTEFEHITPAWVQGHQRQCWQNGGRDNCARNDPVFQVMYVDLFNLTISGGEQNGDRANFRFSPIPGPANQYGSCQFKVDFKQRVAEPPDSAKGKIARVYFYVHHRYNLPMSAQQERILMAWHRQFPVTERELLLHERKAAHMGHTNPFVTGQCQWLEGRKHTCPGVFPAAVANNDVFKQQLRSVTSASSTPVVTRSVSASPIRVRGNKNSQIYHLPACPHYDRIAERNVVEFISEQEALNAGYRKAGNCK
ncbi:endonuclease [Rheinheimera sp.]|uniref:endonuclease n=1 Tax=Rheinheimera sp. TaxID=1869214 RepID=UPI0040488C40